MIKEFLLHKDKKDGNPPHIQAHLAAPTHGRPLLSQKSLHFADPPNRLLTILEQLKTNLWHNCFTFV